MQTDEPFDEERSSAKSDKKIRPNPRAYSYATLRQFPTLCSVPMAVRHNRWAGKEWMRARLKIDRGDTRVWLTDNYRVIVEIRIQSAPTGWPTWEIIEDYPCDDRPKDKVHGAENLNLDPLDIGRSTSEAMVKILERMQEPKRKAGRPRKHGLKKR